VNLSSRIVAIASRVAFVASLVGLGTAAAQTENGFDFGGKRAPLVLAYDPVRSALVGFTIEQERLRRLPGAPVLADDELTGLCGFTSPIGS